ncbi:MAG: hypothetical protein JNL58_32135, partial [Planctomyces sp.]|nr:hypothetical protein [Planctomyces sp.]
VFTAADPAKDDLNLYRYVKNNPVNSTDPSGLISSEEVVDQRSGNHTDHSAAPAVDALGKGFRIGFVEDGFYGDVQMAMYLANPVQVARDAASLAKTHGPSILAGAIGLNGPFLNPARAMEVTEKAVSATPMLMQTLEAVKAIPFGGFEAFRAKAPPEIVDAIDVAKSRTEEIVNEVMRELKNVLGPEIVGRLTGALTYSAAVSYVLGLLAVPITAGASLALSTTKWLKDLTAMITKVLNGLNQLKNGLTSHVRKFLLEMLPGRMMAVLEEVGNLIFSKKNRRRDTDLDRSDGKTRQLADEQRKPKAKVDENSNEESDSDRKTDTLDNNDQERNDQNDRKSNEEADETSSPDDQPNDTGDSGNSRSTEDSSDGKDRETHTDGDGTDADVDPDAPNSGGKAPDAPASGTTPKTPDVPKVATPGGRILSEHAKESLIRHGFKPPFGEIDDIIAQAQWAVKQADGATVHIHKVAGRGRRYRMVVENCNKIVTALKDLTPHELANLAKNNGFALPW